MNGNDIAYRDTTSKITCRDTTWIVSDSRERTLSEQELLALKKHIADCPFCRGASTQFEVLFRGIDRVLKSGTADQQTFES